MKRKLWTSLLLGAMILLQTVVGPVMADDREAITYTAIVPSQGVNDPVHPEEAMTIRRIQEDFGVTLQVEIGPADMTQYHQRLRLLALSDSLPDVVIPWNMQNELIREGYLLALDDLLAEYSPNTATTFTGEQLDWIRYKGDDAYAGKMYVFPVQMNDVYYIVDIRGDWLEKVGMEIPVTLEDWEAVLTAFTYEDPDGNGVDDTYGLGDRPVSIAFMPWLGAYGLMVNTWLENDAGELQWWSTMPEMFDFLTTMAHWYENKLLDPEWVTNVGDVFWNKAYEGKIGTFVHTMGGFKNMNGNIQNNRQDGYVVAAPPPVGPNGQSGMEHLGNVWAGAALSKNIALPERIIEVYDAMFDEDTAIYYLLGEEGVDYTLIEGGGYEILTGEGAYSERGIGFFTMHFVPRPKDMLPKLLSEGTRNIMAAYAGNSIPSAFSGYSWSGEGKAVSSDVGDIQSILTEGIYSVICGKDAVADYQRYIDEWYSSGGDRLTEAANREYEIMRGLED